MLAVLAAANLLSDAELPGIDAVYAFNLPQELIGNVAKTVALVRDSSTMPGDYGNDDFNSVTNEVEIQLFYKKTLDFDPEKLELQLLKLFKHHDWSISDIREHTMDPDTQQLTFTGYFKRLKRLKGVY